MSDNPFYPDHCRTISGQERQYHCMLKEGHDGEHVFENHAPERGTEPGFPDYELFCVALCALVYFT